MNAALTPMRPILHLLSSGGFYGVERMLLDHCRSTPGQHLVLFLGAPDQLAARKRATSWSGAPRNSTRCCPGVDRQWSSSMRSTP